MNCLADQSLVSSRARAPRTLLGLLVALALVLLLSKAAFSEALAGRTFNRVIGGDFAFSNTYEDFAGLTYNALTQTYFMTDNKLDKIMEINASGTLLRTIDIAGLKAPGETATDAEGIAWMYGLRYALVLEGGEEMAIVQITPATVSITRANATIHDLSGDPKGIVYRASEDALYWVSQSGPKRVIKSRFNPATGTLVQLSNINVDSLPIADLADITFFPRISNNPILISQSAKAILEVDLQSGIPVVRSSFTLSPWDLPTGGVPTAGAVTFGADARMYVVGKHTGGVPEDDFNVFQATAAIANRPPAPRIEPL